MTATLEPIQQDSQGKASVRHPWLRTAGSEQRPDPGMKRRAMPEHMRVTQ
jgi:hypothetical protein